MITPTERRMEAFAPIYQNSLADQVTERIREAIIRGNLGPNERLAEPALAAELGVSRSPVREALLRLESDGLVRREANRGFSVWNPTATDVDEILGLRVMMEALAAELLIDKLTDEDFSTLEEIIEQQRQVIEVKGLLRLTRADRRFHAYFVERAGNSRLLNMWNEIMGQWEVLIFLRAEHYPTVPGTVLTDHRTILDALKERNLEKVVTLHRQINDRVGREMKEALHKSSA
jgi:DNA-binding GntR family transcriptional regulator